MKPKWVLIAYENLTVSTPIKRSGGTDTVYVVDPDTLKKSVLEIYVFEGALREGAATIQANVEGSKFIDEGYLFYPMRRHSQIEDIFNEVFPEAKIIPREGLESDTFAWQLMDKIGNLTQSPLQKKNIKPIIYDLIEENPPMSQKIEIPSILADPDAIIAWLSTRTDEEKRLIQESLDIVDLDAKSINKIFRRINSMADILTSEDVDMKRALEKVVKGITAVLGENLAIGINAFDERINSPDGDFLEHYFVSGKDKRECENMKRPFRAKGSAGKVLEMARYYPAAERMRWYVNDVASWKTTWPIELPKLWFMEKDEKPDVASIAYLPFIVGKIRVGIAVIQFSEMHKFTSAEREELSLYAKFASSILYSVLMKSGKILTYEHHEERAIQSLHSISTKIEFYKTADWAATLEDIYERITKIFAPKNLKIIKRESLEKSYITEKYLRGGNSLPSGSFNVISNGIIDKIIKTQEPILIKDNVEDYLQKNGIDMEYVNFKSYLGVPIKFDDQICGIIEMYDTERERAYNNNDCVILQTLANFLGSAY